MVNYVYLENIQKEEIIMIKIIKHGYMSQCKCDSCKSILSFNRREDMKKVSVGEDLIHFYITCPVCFNEILVGWKWSNGSVFFPSGNIVEE